MWFLSSIITFGLGFFTMFRRLVSGRYQHFINEAENQRKLAKYLKSIGKEPPVTSQSPKQRNAKLWAASIILIIPAFVIIYLLIKDLSIHEKEEDAYLSATLPERVFMPQTIPQTTYVLITIVTLGVGAVYWLYKTVNLYNQHYKADLVVEKEIARLMGENGNIKRM